MIRSSPLLQKFFVRQLLLATCINTILLTGILLYGNLHKHGDFFLQTLGFSSDLVIELVLHLVPYSLSMGLPFGFSLAVLFCVGRWAADREILALRSHGISLWQWTWPIFATALFLSMVSMYATLEWGPVNRAKFEERKREIVWGNLRNLISTQGQIEFSIPSSSQDSQFSGLGAFSSSKLSKVAISVSEALEDRWKKVRLVLTGEDNQILSVLHANHAQVARSDDLSKLILHLRDVDVEPGFDEGPSQDKLSNGFLSFKKWKQPVVIDVLEKANSNRLPFKRMGIMEKLAYMESAPSEEQLREVRFLIHKGLALGSSPFFLGLFLVPLAAQRGRRESMINLLIGILTCLSYFAIGSFMGNFLIQDEWGFCSWWCPNFLCLFFGALLIRRGN